jgi:hypothetical protein
VRKEIVCRAVEFIVAKFCGVQVLTKAILFWLRCLCKNEEAYVLIRMATNVQSITSGVSYEFIYIKDVTFCINLLQLHGDGL